MNCLHPVQVWYDAGDVRVPGPMVPCGRCDPCRKARANEWAVRLMHEASYWTRKAFVTLTYNDAHLPDDKSLDKAELQRFFKRVRKALGERDFKYFAAGEYGEDYGRPHYHFIGFGIDEMDNKLIEEKWGKGFVSIGTVTIESCRYVSNYVLKANEGGIKGKDYGKRAAPFRMSSQKLGSRYVNDNSEQILQHYYITVNGVKTALPRYYVKQLGDKVDKDILNKQTLERADARESAYADEGIGPLEAWQQEALIRVRKGREFEAEKERSKKRKF